MSNTEQQSSAKLRGKRLRLIRKMSNLNLNDLANKYNFGISTIKYWECGKGEGLSIKGAKKIIKAMQSEGVQCSYAWLMNGIGLQPQFVDVCLSNKVKQSKLSDSNIYEEEKSIDQEIALFCKSISDAVTLNIFDDGMEPIYCYNDSIGGKRVYDQDLHSVMNKDCIVETEDNQILCRRIAQGNDKDSFNLYCINSSTKANPPNMYNIKLLSAAPISRIWKRSV